MGDLKKKKLSANEWKSVELSSEEHDFLQHFDISIQTQLELQRELLRDYLNTIAARYGFDPSKDLEFDIVPEDAVVKIRTIE